MNKLLDIDFDVKNLKVVVPISGGKDSQATLKVALQEYNTDEILGVFCDTKFDHPITYKHISDITTLYGVKIHTISAGSVPEIVTKFKRFPDFRNRVCTDRLKILSSKNFYLQLSYYKWNYNYTGFQVWYGMRLSESNLRGKKYKNIIDTELYDPNDVISSYPKRLDMYKVSFRLPILNWSTDDVLAFLDGEENPLYSKGFDRVGCFPCLISSDTKKLQCFNFDAFGSKQLALCQELDKITVNDLWNKDKSKEGICSFCSI